MVNQSYALLFSNINYCIISNFSNYSINLFLLNIDFYLFIFLLWWETILQLLIEPELKTNRPLKKLLPSGTPDERVYEPEGVGLMIKKGEEVDF